MLLKCLKKKVSSWYSPLFYSQREKAVLTAFILLAVKNCRRFAGVRPMSLWRLCGSIVVKRNANSNCECNVMGI